MNPVLELRDVTKSYADVLALSSVNLSVEPGELLAIVGPSGSGKSTMLNVMGTLDLPTSGTVVVDGLDIATLNDRQLSALRARTIGFVFQQFHLATGTSALDNVADGLLYSGLRRDMRQAIARRALERVGLGHRLTHLPHQLSGGERQRVAIARAIADDPAVLLADEPTGNLDSASGRGIRELLSDLHAAGSTIVVITHDREFAETLPRRVAVRDGVIESDSASVDA